MLARPCRRTIEVHLVGQSLSKLVRVAGGMHAVRFYVTEQVCAGQPQLAGRGRR